MLNIDPQHTMADHANTKPNTVATVDNETRHPHHAMSSPSPPPPPRPYTSYNLFFQLEREYILQELHGHRPTLAPGSAFDPSAPTYPPDAPALPARYAGLALPYDWHIPGKARRRKRSHRKSHGKVGFHELNDRISRAWSEAEDEVRDFCARLADIEALKYKRTKVKRRGKAKKEKASKIFPTSDLKNEGVDLLPTFDWTANFPNFGREGGDSFAPAKITLHAAPLGGSIVDMDLDCLTRSTASLRDSLASSATTIAEVDMEDGDILDIWETTRVVNERSIESILSTSRVCVEIKTVANGGGATRGDERDDAGASPAGARRGKVLRKPESRVLEQGRDDAARTSFIDAEYEKYREIGKRFPAATRRGLPGGPHKNAFAACQA